MYFNNALRLQAFSFIVLAVFLSPAAVARDQSALPAEVHIASVQVSGLDVSLEHISGGKVLTTKTDEKGSFTFSDVGPGNYKLRIGCPGTGAISRDVAGGAGVQRCYAEFRVEIADKSRGEIRGSIRRKQ